MNRRCLALATLLLVTAAGTPARADDAYAAAQQVAASAFAEIRITNSIVAGITHVTPAAGSVPADWSCSPPDQDLAHYEVSCDPILSGAWSCPQPYVVVSYVGTSLDTVIGTSNCGGTPAACSPTQALLIANMCENTATTSPTSFTCRVDWGNHLDVTTTEWSVLCRTYTGNSGGGSDDTGSGSGVITVPGAGMDVYYGLTCGLTSASDPTGQVVQNPDRQTGELHAGPWTVLGASAVTITCAISIGDGVIDAGDLFVSQTTPGGTGTTLSTLQYDVAAGQEVYVCTQVSWNYGLGGDGSWQPGEDGPCRLATSVG